MRTRAIKYALALIVAVACRETGRVDAATLERTANGVLLHVTILGAPTDSRIAPAREALGYWNRTFTRLGRQVQLDSGTVRPLTISDDLLRAAMGEVAFGVGPATSRLRDSMAIVPGDLIIALSGTDLISFSVPYRSGGQGGAVIRRADIPPLTLPNTVRNVVAHEMGHALGLQHNTDSTTLMCGRPANCRPAAFASDTARFFPLTAEDETVLRKRWP